MAKPKKLDLSTIGGGDLQAIVSRELNHVCENIADPNTPAEAIRTITVKIKIKPDKKRNMARVAYFAQTALPASDPGSQIAFVALDQGEMALFPMDTRQGELPLDPTVSEIQPVSTDNSKAAFAPPHPNAS